MSEAGGAALDDVIVTISQAFGTVDIPLSKWMANGPPGRSALRPRAPRSGSTGKPLAPTVVPLAFRNDDDSLKAILQGRVEEPWGRPRRYLAVLLFNRRKIDVRGLKTAANRRKLREIADAALAVQASYRDLVVALDELAPLAIHDAEQAIDRWHAVSKKLGNWRYLQRVIREEEALWASRGALGRVLAMARGEYLVRTPRVTRTRRSPRSAH